MSLEGIWAKEDFHIKIARNCRQSSAIGHSMNIMFFYWVRKNNL